MHITDVIIVEIEQQHLMIFKNLAQAYEAEFSKLTHKMPDTNGLFNIDTFPSAPYVGYLLYYQQRPVGFCVANVETELKYMAEFYIVPVMRKKNLGFCFAAMIFDQHPGQWQVRQIAGADDALHFWRRVITQYTQNHYEESVVEDMHWGTVTQQRFNVLVKNEYL